MFKLVAITNFKDKYTNEPYVAGQEIEVEEERALELLSSTTPVVRYLSHEKDSNTNEEALKTEVDTLKAENETLKAEYETLKAENETLKAEYETLKAENETLKETVDTLNADQDNNKNKDQNNKK